MAKKPKITDVSMPVSGQAEASVAAVLGVLDQAAVEMERKWGVGKLQRLVEPEMAARFAASHERLNHAIESKDLDSIIERANNHTRGWYAMDKMATEKGHSPTPQGVWSASADGIAYTVVYDESDLPKVAQTDAKAVTLKELLLAYQSVSGDVAPVKAAFPGAKIKHVRSVKKERDDTIDYWKDEIPL